MQSCENNSQQRFALFGCLCEDISGHRTSATAFLAHLQPFIDGGHVSDVADPWLGDFKVQAKDMGLFHHALVVLRVLIYSSDVVLHNILGLETDGSNHAVLRTRLHPVYHSIEFISTTLSQSDNHSIAFTKSPSLNHSIAFTETFCLDHSFSFAQPPLSHSLNHPFSTTRSH